MTEARPSFRRGPRWARHVAAVLALLALWGCGRGVSAPPVVSLQVAAASSLTDVLPPLAQAFERAQGGRVRVAMRFGPSQRLARQLLEGAEADVFISADPRWIDPLVASGRIPAACRARIASHRLVAVVPREGSAHPRTLSELVSLEAVAVAARDAPAGMHARAALARDGLLERAQGHLVEGADVRAALGWVARGEADAGLVYASDAQAEPRVRVAFEVPWEGLPPIVVEAVGSARGPSGDPRMEPCAFVASLGSETARRALLAAGFGSAP